MNSSSNAFKWKLSTGLFAVTTVILAAYSFHNESVPGKKAHASSQAGDSGSRTAALRSLRIPDELRLQNA